MRKFGKNPPRSLESFGVSGLLSEPCKVYYDTVFTVRHIGRVSDLLNARLKNVGLDELRFRIILLFSLYETYRCQMDSLAKPGVEVLPEPLVVECGVDDEKIIIGVSFTYSKEEAVDLNLEQKINSGGAKTRIERLIAQLSADSDQSLVRIDPVIRQVEVLSFLALPGKIDAAILKERRPVEVMILKTETGASSVNADYIELGDLNYSELLKNDKPGARPDKSGTGEFLVKAILEEEKPPVRISSVIEQLAESERRIKADPIPVALPETESEPDLGELQKLLNRKAGAPAPALASEPDAEFENQVIEEIKLLDLPEMSVAVSTVVPTPLPAISDQPKSPLHKWFHKVWPFNLPVETQNRHDTSSARARNDRILSDHLNAERVRIAEEARRMNHTLRQKEIELRNKESALNETLRRKEEQLRHKTYALERAKEQISQLTMAAERAKAKVKNSPGNTELETKYELIVRQNEEFRKANQLLMEERVARKSNSEASSGSGEEAKEKLAAAMRFAAKQQKEANQLRLELQKANETIQSLKKRDDRAA